MADQPQLPAEQQRNEIGTYEKTAVPADPLTIETIADRQQDRQMRLDLARKLIRILIVELIFFAVVFFLIGAGCLAYEEWTVNLFLAAIPLQTWAVVKVVFENLFPKR